MKTAKQLRNKLETNRTTRAKFKFYTETRTCSRCDCSTVNLEQDKCSNCGTPFPDVVLAKIVAAAKALNTVENYSEARALITIADRVCDNLGIVLTDDAEQLRDDLYK